MTAAAESGALTRHRLSGALLFWVVLVVLLSDGDGPVPFARSNTSLRSSAADDSVYDRPKPAKMAWMNVTRDAASGDFGERARTVGWATASAALGACSKPLRCEKPCGSPAQPCVTLDTGNATRCTCPAPHCMVDAAGRCATSPLWLTEVPRGTERPDNDSETTCFGPSLAEAYDAVLDGWFTDAPPAERRSTSTRLTSATAEFGDLHAAHNKTDGLYDVRNACVAWRVDTGAAVLIGTRLANATSASALDPYDGVLELHQQFLGASDEFQAWVNHPVLFDGTIAALADVAESFHVVHGPGFVFHVGVKSDNAKHQLHRAATATEILRHRYGLGYRGRVTTVFAVDSTARAEQDALRLNGLAAFLGVFGRRALVANISANANTSTAASNTRAAPAVSQASRELLGKQQLPRFRRVVCFRELTVSQVCRSRCQSQSPWRKLRGSPAEIRRKHHQLRQPAPLGSQFYLAWSGHRTPGDPARISRFRDLLQACAGLPSGRVVDARRPRVVIVWRSGSRRFLGFPATAAALAKSAYEALGVASLDIIEHVRLRDETGAGGSNAVVRAFSRADIVISMIGGGLTWAFLMPPGAVTVELVYNFGCSAKFPQGWNTAPLCDYGGTGAVAGHEYLLLRLSNACAVGPKEDTSVYLPAATWVRILEAAVCRLRKRAAGSSASTNGTMSTLCDDGVPVPVCTASWPRDELRWS